MCTAITPSFPCRVILLQCSFVCDTAYYFIILNVYSTIKIVNYYSTCLIVCGKSNDIILHKMSCKYKCYDSSNTLYLYKSYQNNVTWEIPTLKPHINFILHVPGLTRTQSCNWTRKLRTARLHTLLHKYCSPTNLWSFCLARAPSNLCSDIHHCSLGILYVKSVSAFRA